MKKWLSTIRPKSAYNSRILEAARSGNVRSLRQLLNEDGRKQPSPRTIQQALSLSIDACSVQCVRLTLEAGAKPNCIKSPKEHIPIPFYVIKEGLHDVLEVLLEHGCSVTLGWMTNDTILHFAVRCRDLEAVRLILRAGGSSVASNERHETPLTLAVSQNAIQILGLLLEQPESLESSDGEGRTLLHLAARRGSLEVAQCLLERGFIPDITDINGYTPLIDAVMHNQEHMVQMLASKCDIDYAGWRGMTAVLFAAQANKEECLKILLESGASVNMQDVMGNTALIHGGPFQTILNVLLDHGMDVDLQNNVGMTALWFAAFYRYEAIVFLLLRANSDPELKGLVEDEFHTSPLEIALKRGHYDISRQIIYSGCNNRNLARFMENADLMPVFRNSPEGQALKQWVRQWLIEVKPLKYLARLAIRRSLGRIKVMQKIKELPLPDLLIHYVDLHELPHI